MIGMTKHRRSVQGFVLRLVGSDALAEDLTQETFLRVERSTSQYRGEASEYSWLCAIALNLVRDHFRSVGRTPEIISDETVLEVIPTGDKDAEQTLLLAEMSSCIAEFLTRLPSPQYNVVALYDMAGLSHREIATRLDISESNSRVLLHRGRSALREIMKQGCDLSFGDDVIPCERHSPRE